MTILRFRVTGSRDAVDEIISRLHGIDGIEHVEEVDDEISDIREDSSSADSSESVGIDAYRIEVRSPHASTREQVQSLMELSARDLEVVVEDVDRF